MFCKHCGKEIANDSKFCKYCGEVVEEHDQFGFSEDISSTNTLNDESNKGETVLTTDETNPIQVEILHKHIINKVTFANEVIANVKIIVIATLLWIAYIIGFSLYRSEDSSTTSAYGASCYDDSIPEEEYYGWDWCWEAYYLLSVHNLEPVVLLTPFYVSSHDSAENLRRAEEIAKRLGLSEDLLCSLRSSAQSEAEAARGSFMNMVYSNRTSCYEAEKEEHKKWAAIILILVPLIGRYILKFFKWVFRTANSK